MTQSAPWPALVVQTLRDPEGASEIVLATRFPRQVLWTAVALVSVANTMLAYVSHLLMPVPEPLASIVTSPFGYFTLVAGGFIVMVHALYWTGRMLGGAQDMGDLLQLLIWLQVLRTGAQALIIVLLILSPAIATLVLLFIGIATLWIFLNFLNIGLRLNSIWHAIGVLIAGSAALVLGLSLFLSLIGVTAMGVPANV
ncbi:YIP1 family protein [uncultured Roseobacter sp.]|uniref:YIP1 family protein n=1 Tax=uncultured Roseobacter sp. TaxID=114847 RepID=UPI0026129B3C|nr:YIP1 family protein [uncultured Roseobacter sp.]